MGYSLKDIEYYVHGTSTKEVGGRPGELLHDGGRNVFMAVDMEVVRRFAFRKVADIGGEVSGMLLILDKATDRGLEEYGFLRAKQIDDMEGKIEYVFSPASAEIINRVGI